MTFDVPNCPLSLGDTVVYMEHIQNVHVFTTGFQQIKSAVHMFVALQAYG